MKAAAACHSAYMWYIVRSLFMSGTIPASTCIETAPDSIAHSPKPMRMPDASMRGPSCFLQGRAPSQVCHSQQFRMHSAGKHAIKWHSTAQHAG